MNSKTISARAIQRRFLFMAFIYSYKKSPFYTSLTIRNELLPQFSNNNNNNNRILSNHMQRLICIKTGGNFLKASSLTIHDSLNRFVIHYLQDDTQESACGGGSSSSSKRIEERCQEEKSPFLFNVLTTQ